MAPALTGSEISFGRAALAAGVSERTLRGWLDRKQVTLTAETARPGKGWRRFTLGDVVRIGIMARIVNYGFGVEAADAIMCKHYDPAAFTARLNSHLGPEAEWKILHNSLSMKILVVCFDGRSAGLIGGLPHEKIAFIQGGTITEELAGPWMPAPGSESFIDGSDTVEDFAIIRMGVIAKAVARRLLDTQP